MLNQYLGNYLLNRGLIDKPKLSEILEEHSKRHIKFGTLAINEGLMNSTQVEEVNQMQKNKDKKFGEIAVEMGYLSEPDIPRLLKKQKTSTIELSQLLLDKNIFSLKELEDILTEFKEDSKTELDHINYDNLLKSYIDRESKNIDNYNINNDFLLKYSSLVLRHIIRFIDFGCFFDQTEILNSLDDKVICKQKLIGDVDINTYIACEEDVFNSVASAYGNIPILRLGKLSYSSVSEFLNLANGLFTINLNEEDLNIHLDPPETVEIKENTLLNNSIVFSFLTKYGNIFLIVEQNKKTS